MTRLGSKVQDRRYLASKYYFQETDQFPREVRTDKLAPVEKGALILFDLFETLSVVCVRFSLAHLRVIINPHDAFYEI